MERKSVFIKTEIIERLKNVIQSGTGGVRNNVDRILEAHIKREEKKLGIEENVRKYEGQ